MSFKMRMPPGCPGCPKPGAPLLPRLTPADMMKWEPDPDLIARVLDHGQRSSNQQPSVTSTPSPTQSQ
jgi:hypothetical protein